MTFTAKDIRGYQTKVKNNTPRFISQHRAAFDNIIDTITKQIQKTVSKNPEALRSTIDITALIKSADGIDPVTDSGRFKMALISELESLGFNAVITSDPKTLNYLMDVTWIENKAYNQDVILERLDKIDAAIASLAKNLDLSGSETRISTQLDKVDKNINDVKSEVKDNYYAIRSLDCY